jgi:hypothetical protein
MERKGEATDLKFSFLQFIVHSIFSNDVTRRGRSKINRSAYTGPTHAVAW